MYTRRVERKDVPVDCNHARAPIPEHRALVYLYTRGCSFFSPLMIGGASLSHVKVVNLPGISSRVTYTDEFGRCFGFRSDRVLARAKCAVY